MNEELCYPGEKDGHGQIIEGQLDTEDPKSEYYVAFETPTGENKLVRVPKVIYDSKMDLVKMQVARVREELRSFIKGV